MVKIKLLSRSSGQHKRETIASLDPVYHNPDPVIHPFERPREYVRALNATKLDKLLAKPFVGALSGHNDGVYTIRRHPEDIQFLASGSGDGELRVWHLPTKQVRWRVARAHQGLVRSVIYGKEDRLLSVGTDKIVKLWDPSASFQSLSVAGEKYSTRSAGFLAAAAAATQFDDAGDPYQLPPVATWVGDDAFTALDHQRKPGGRLSRFFATGSASDINVWTYERSESTQRYQWGSGSILSLSFNPVQTSSLVATTSDREIIFFDMRSSSPTRKFNLLMRSNIVAWNPTEAFNFTLANEDHNCYTFDARNLRQALNIHRDHVGPVISLDFSPTGHEFATGSYDKTVRLFEKSSSNSREVYFSRRMQRVFSVQYSGDANFVFSGSDDTNIRIWKAKASAPLGTLLPREKQRLAYHAKLQERYRHVPELRRIAHHRHVPKPILKAQKLKQTMKQARARKEHQVFRHARPDQRKLLEKEKKRVVLAETS